MINLIDILKVSKHFAAVFIFLFITLLSPPTFASTSQGHHAANQEPIYRSIEIFPLVKEHVHSPTIVELPNGCLLTAWYQGSGERQADDVAIMGARLQPGHDKWSEPFIMADVLGFPDINPILFIDPQDRLWLMWYTVIANQWETSLLKYRISEDYMMQEGPPRWSWQDVLLVKPGDPTESGIQPDDKFIRSIERQIEQYAQYLLQTAEATEKTAEEKVLRWRELGAELLSKARGEDMKRKGYAADAEGRLVEQLMGYPYYRRLGWQTKNKPLIVDKKRIIIPLYSDGFSFSLMAITDNFGKTWQFSEPLVGPGNIQPCILQKADNTLVAYMRDNGPPPKRLHISSSSDKGFTWSVVKDSELPNPGSGADAVTLRNGHWALVYNDTEHGRNSLAISISTDEGKTWAYTRHLERDLREEAIAIRSRYPAIIQGSDMTLHVVYSHRYNDLKGKPNNTIKYVQLNEAWVVEASLRPPLN